MKLSKPEIVQHHNDLPIAQYVLIMEQKLLKSGVLGFQTF